MGEQTRRAVTIVILAVVALSLGVGAGALRRSPPAFVPESTDPHAADIPETIEVHVVGWVVAPGVVSVPNGAIVAMAVEAAGGLRSGARVESINLAAEVQSGEQIVVPGPGPEENGVGPAPDGLIPLNTASAADLEALPGVGPVLAERIISFREDNGPFQAVEDLLQVPGIGEAKLRSIRDLVRP